MHEVTKSAAATVVFLSVSMAATAPARAAPTELEAALWLDAFAERTVEQPLAGVSPASTPVDNVTHNLINGIDFVALLKRALIREWRPYWCKKSGDELVQLFTATMIDAVLNYVREHPVSDFKVTKTQLNARGEPQLSASVSFGDDPIDAKIVVARKNDRYMIQNACIIGACLAASVSATFDRKGVGDMIRKWRYTTAKSPTLRIVQQSGLRFCDK
ncbi:MAG: hypothetical protein QNJ92_12975 [Alphaproteobacteria bacterium]|nr:hypothetical protein [Alphaproteobacteria bacterium]